MGQEARVSSIPVLKELRASLGTFAQVASLALEETSTAIYRTRQWLREDRNRYWKTQVQSRSEQYTRAKLALHQRQVFERTLAGTPSSCVDEKKALKIAEARLREAEHKLRRVQAWNVQIERELSDYRAGTQRLASAVDVEIPNAQARLDKMIDALEAYLALAPPEMAPDAHEVQVVDLQLPTEPEAPDPPPELPNPKSDAQEAT
jgi:soluble cytochrome b562